MRWWIAILVVAALVHNYLLFTVGAVWGTATLRNFLIKSSDNERFRVLGRAFATVVPLVLVISCLGIHRDFVASEAYGVFAMPLDALWRPSNPTYSMLMTWPEQRLQSAFEGFQYLGAGLLLLIATTFFAALRMPPHPQTANLNRRLFCMIPACVALTMLAITNQIAWDGQIVLHLPLSPAIKAFLDPLRASGRLFWLVSYILVLAAITTAYRLSLARSTQLLGVVLSLQILDMSGIMIAIKRVTATATETDQWKRTRDPRWPSVIASANDVTFAPNNPFVALDLFQEVAWRSVSAGRPIRLVYAARNSRATDARLAAEQADFEAGRLEPQRLYVLFPEAKVPESATSRLLVLDGIRLLVPVPAFTRSVPS